MMRGDLISCSGKRKGNRTLAYGFKNALPLFPRGKNAVGFGQILHQYAGCCCETKSLATQAEP